MLQTAVKLEVQEKSETTIKSLLRNTSLIIGNPSYQTTGSINIIQTNKWKTIQISNDDYDQAKLGYSVTSGHYFSKNKISFASGAPGWKYVGKVVIINNSGSDLKVTRFVYGNEFGEYFGASLTSGDLNNDGFDDLVVGAPHYGDDSGKVYIYLGSEEGFLNHNPVIIGSVIGAQFGYSLSCGDLDQDGFFDLIVGAPWEKSGVIYIYNGYSMLDQENTLVASQKISASEISSAILGFGFSISNLADVDNNGFADIAVGAYKSGHAVIFRSKPVENSPIILKAQPAVLKRSSQPITTEFCFKNYKNIPPQIIKNYTVTIFVDSKYKRSINDYIIWNIPIQNKDYLSFSYMFATQKLPKYISKTRWSGCSTSNFYMKANINNFIDPIDMTLKYELKSYEVSKNQDSNHFCKLCPIKYISRESKPIQLLLPFETDCKKSTDCQSDISVTTSTYGVGINNTWNIGSEDVSVEMKFQNHGAPAYLVTVDFRISKGIHLRSILPFCHEDMFEHALAVKCDYGNFDKGVQKILRLDLDMRHFHAPNITNMEQQKLFINVTIKSRNDKHSLKTIVIPLILKHNISLSVAGKTDQDSFYFASTDDKNTNITFQHVYSIFKHGTTPITEGTIIIQIPLRINHGETFIKLKKPQLEGLGSSYKCISKDIPLDTLPFTHPATLLNNFNKFNAIGSIHADEIIDMKTQHVNNTLDKLSEYTNSTTYLNKNEENIVFLNCSNERVQCGSVICDLTPLKSNQDIGVVALSLTLNLDILKEIFHFGTVLQFSTKAEINVIKPLRNKTETQILTTFYKMKEIYKEELNIWTILLSVVIGIVILVIVSSALYYVGFFKKKQRLALENNREQEQYLAEELNEQNSVEGSIENISLSSG